MKLLILFSLFTFSQFAFSSEWNPVNPVVNCNMKIIENQTMDQSIANEMIEMLKILNENNGEQLLKQCKALKKRARKAPYHSYDGIQKFFEYDYNMDHRTLRVRKALYNFSYGDYHCKIIGAEVDVALGIHLGVGANVGTCMSSTGKRYLIASPELSIGVGLGAYVLFETTEFDLEPGETIHMDDRGMDIVVGMGYASSTSFKGSDETVGGGLGIGISLKSGVTMNLKLIPYGRNYGYLWDNLEDGLKLN